jgi:uncharacterized membrane protein (UPF0136 family)
MEPTMNDRISGAEARQDGEGWWLFLIIGMLSVVAGVIILFRPGESLSTLAVIAGIFLLLDGILALADSLLHNTRNHGLVALLGVLSAIVGVLLIRHPSESVPRPDRHRASDHRTLRGPLRVSGAVRRLSRDRPTWTTPRARPGCRSGELVGRSEGGATTP